MPSTTPAQVVLANAADLRLQLLKHEPAVQIFGGRTTSEEDWDDLDHALRAFSGNYRPDQLHDDDWVIDGDPLDDHGDAMFACSRCGLEYHAGFVPQMLLCVGCLRDSLLNVYREVNIYVNNRLIALHGKLEMGANNEEVLHVIVRPRPSDTEAPTQVTLRERGEGHEIFQSGVFTYIDGYIFELLQRPHNDRQLAGMRALQSEFQTDDWFVLTSRNRPCSSSEVTTPINARLETILGLR